MERSRLKNNANKSKQPTDIAYYKKTTKFGRFIKQTIKS